MVWTMIAGEVNYSENIKKGENPKVKKINKKMPYFC